ncbi:hypothetical protein EJB05_01006, partial [Eragrostis curvula]
MAPSPATMQLLVVLLCLAASSELLTVIHGQLDSPGFISIDCGIAADRTYSDQSTSGLRYVSDAGFTDAGLNGVVGPPYDQPDMAERYRTVRYFPGDGAAPRSCYTLRPVTPGGKYLVRAAFYYGNYDGLNRPPVFDLHIGVNSWATVNVTAAGDRYILEAVVVSPDDFLQVCLVNTGLGTPFVSGLDLRPLRWTMYPEATVNQSLLLLSLSRPSATFGFNRYNFWPAGYPLFRYPYDPYDRLWQRYGTVAAWTNINTSATVDVSNINSFDKPTDILRSATTPVNGSRIDISWSPDAFVKNNDTTYLLLLYFAELQRLQSNALRQFDILVDDAAWNGSQGFTPKYLSAEVMKRMVQGSGRHTVSLVATRDATLPPILNAFEIYSVKLMTEVATNDTDDKWMANTARLNSPRDMSNIIENRRFTYKELKLMTSNFREEIGRGGFGGVFLGYLENGSPVAVKMHSKTSSQGDKEFLAEAQHLSRVHHRNIVSLIGFCKDKKHMTLVYEYMHGGNLEDRLRGEAAAATSLTWHQRLKIALDSAHGLEYLHKSCQPPLIHRDVKTRNILLSGDLEAKIADFGLMKAFANEFMSHVTTMPAGTLGYLDPEYYHTSQLSEKSDVYSFGVVLLELITGQSPAVPISNTESIHIALWVRQKLSKVTLRALWTQGWEGIMMLTLSGKLQSWL